jgi:hypothetical protein
VSLADVAASDTDRLVSGPWDPAFGGGIARDHVVMLAGAPGGGKCLGRDTPVLMYDGSIKKVQDIIVGNMLMGPDSRPRKVRHVSYGRSGLYKIVPVKGEPWVCNANHILTLISSHTGKVFDVRLFERPMTDLKLFRVGVDFPKGPRLPLPPYFVGIWFGDGTKALRYLRKKGKHEIAGVHITKEDPEIIDYLESMATKWALKINRYRNAHKSCPTLHLANRQKGRHPNRLLEMLREVVGLAEKLPQSYLVSSREDRLELLAGLLDTDGYSHHGGFEIAQKRKGIADDICFLARSLGFAAYMKAKWVKGECYWRISISGDCSGIPTRIPRKQATQRQQCKNVLRTGFSIALEPDGEHFGFTLDGDGRFLLGDFTVTHNSSVCLQIAHAVSKWNNRVLYIAKEESAGAIRARANRFGFLESEIVNVTIVSSFRGRVRDLMREHKPMITIVDSLPSLVGLGAGHLDDAAEVLSDLKEYAVKERSPAIVVTMVTKELDFAGEMALQHLCDATFLMTVDRKTGHRVLQAVKNRAGSVEVAVRFLMSASGLHPVPESDSEKKTPEG